MNFFSGLMSGDAGTERRRLAGESPDGETRSPGDSRRLNQARALMQPPSDNANPVANLTSYSVRGAFMRKMPQRGSKMAAAERGKRVRSCEQRLPR